LHGPYYFGYSTPVYDDDDDHLARTAVVVS